MVSRIAALFVETDGAYFGLDGVDPWDEPRDARRYSGPWPVIAHPPCQRWGRFWHGSPRKPHQFRKGEDGGCLATAITAARNYGGVVEQPYGSTGFKWFGIRSPDPRGGWTAADDFGGFVCYVEQGQYGHEAQKPTLLYAAKVQLPELTWGEHPSPHFKPIEDIGGKDKVGRRERTPPRFRDVLIEMARSAHAFGIA